MRRPLLFAQNSQLQIDKSGMLLYNNGVMILQIASSD